METDHLESRLSTRTYGRRANIQGFTANGRVGPQSALAPLAMVQFIIVLERYGEMGGVNMVGKGAFDGGPSPQRPVAADWQRYPPSLPGGALCVPMLQTARRNDSAKACARQTCQARMTPLFFHGGAP